MEMQPGAFKALCEDLTKWRDRVQNVIEHNASLDRDAVIRDVLDGADGLLGRFLFVPNAASITDPIKQALETFYFRKRDGERRVVELPQSYSHDGREAISNELACSMVWGKYFQIPGRPLSDGRIEELRNVELGERRSCLERVVETITCALNALATGIEQLPLRPAWLVHGRNKDAKLIDKPGGEVFEEPFEARVRVGPIHATYFDGRASQPTQYAKKTLTRERYVLTDDDIGLVRDFCHNNDPTKPDIDRIEKALVAQRHQPLDEVRKLVQDTFLLLECLKVRQRLLEPPASNEVRPSAAPKGEGMPVDEFPPWEDIERELFGLLTLKQRSLFETLWESRNTAVKWEKLKKSYTGSKGERAIQVALKEIPKRCVKSKLARVDIPVPSTISRHTTVTMTVERRAQSRAEK